MKNYPIKWFILSLILLAAIDLIAQQAPALTKDQSDRPFMFSKLAQRYECKGADLQKIFSYKISDKVSFPIGDNQLLTGEVVDRVVHPNGVISINIRSINFPGAFVSISRYKAADGPEKINGQIINPKSGDVLLITEENNKYIIRKELQRLFMAECPVSK